MPYTPNSIVNEAFSFEDFTFTYYITGNPDPVGIVGKAVTFDPSAPSSVALAGDGDHVFGRIYQYEDRTQQGGGKTVSVERKFRRRLPKDDAEVIALGDTVVGAGAGLVRAATTGDTPAAADPEVNTVIQVETDYVVVEKF